MGSRLPFLDLRSDLLSVPVLSVEKAELVPDPLVLVVDPWCLDPRRVSGAVGDAAHAETGKGEVDPVGRPPEATRLFLAMVEPLEEVRIAEAPQGASDGVLREADRPGQRSTAVGNLGDRLPGRGSGREGFEHQPGDRSHPLTHNGGDVEIDDELPPIRRHRVR